MSRGNVGAGSCKNSVQPARVRSSLMSERSCGATVSPSGWPTRRRGGDVPTRRARRSPLHTCAPTARRFSCRLGGTSQCLRHCDVCRESCHEPHLYRSHCACGWQSISSKFKSGNDLSATEIRKISVWLGGHGEVSGRQHKSTKTETPDQDPAVGRCSVSRGYVATKTRWMQKPASDHN
jgi:hypothetical protein